MSVELGPTPTARETPRTGGTTEPPQARRSGVFALVGIVVLLGGLGVVLPALVAAHYDALNIPRADDWSYLLTLFHWVDSGRLTFNGWVSMTLVGQIAIAWPVVAIAGHNITTIHLFTAVIGLVGLLAVVFIGRDSVRTPWWGVFVAAMIAVSPIWGPLAPTFMTDIPTFTVEMLAITAAGVAFRRRSVSLPWFAVSMAIAFVGVTIRQYAIVPMIAIALIAICMLVAAHDRRKLRIVIVITAIGAVASLALLAWWSGLPDSKSLTPKLPNIHLVSAVAIKDAGFLRLAGLLVMPVIVLAGPVTIVRRAWHASQNMTTLLATVVTLWLAAMWLHVPKTPFAGAYVTRDGVLSNFVLAGKRPDIMPTLLYDLLVLIGSVGGILIVLAAVPFFADLPRRYRDRELLTIEQPLIALMALTLVGFAAAYSLVIVTGLPVYDRYALPLLPLVAFLLLHATQSEPRAAHVDASRTAWAGVAIVLLAVVGFVYTADSASFDGTRWKVAEAAVHKGFAPTEVGGGAEWLGYHRQHGPAVVPSEGGQQQQRHNKLFSTPCVTVVVNPHPRPPASRIVAEAQFTAPSRAPVPIIAMRNKRPCKR